MVENRPSVTDPKENQALPTSRNEKATTSVDTLKSVGDAIKHFTADLSPRIDSAKNKVAPGQLSISELVSVVDSLKQCTDKIVSSPAGIPDSNIVAAQLILKRPISEVESLLKALETYRGEGRASSVVSAHEMVDGTTFDTLNSLAGEMAELDSRARAASGELQNEADKIVGNFNSLVTILTKPLTPDNQKRTAEIQSELNKFQDSIKLLSDEVNNRLQEIQKKFLNLNLDLGDTPRLQQLREQQQPLTELQDFLNDLTVKVNRAVSNEGVLSNDLLNQQYALIGSQLHALKEKVGLAAPTQ